MKYLAVLFFVVVATKAQVIEDEVIIESQPAQFMPMGMNQMMNPMMMSRNQFPVDYSMGCSRSCGCVQRCQMIWWMPCNCWCPPPCGTTTDLPQITPAPTTTTWTTTTSSTTSTTSTTSRPTTTAPKCCCQGCSCNPCTIWWMCPPRCPGNCCSGGCNPCNTPPPPPPCCSCPPCLPWTPCSPCNCNNPCATTTAPLKKEPEPEYEDPRFPNLRDRIRNGLEVVMVPRQPEPEPIPDQRPWRMW